MSDRIRRYLSPEEWAMVQLRRAERQGDDERVTLLAQECDDAGIPIETVRHYWYKSEQFSINASGPPFDKNKFFAQIRETISSYAPEFPIVHRPSVDPQILIVPIADPHFGKLGVRDVGGNLTYDLSIARERLTYGVHDVFLPFVAG